MDDYIKQASLNGSGGSRLAQGLTCLITLACLGGIITYWVYLGIYAYNNPDPTDCFWGEGLTHSYSVQADA